MVFKKKPARKKNQTKTFIDGKESSEDDVPDKIPELEVPKPPKKDSMQEEQNSQAIYDEGRSVGFQEGMIYAMQILDSTLKQHQDKLKEKYAEQQR